MNFHNYKHRLRTASRHRAEFGDTFPEDWNQPTPYGNVAPLPANPDDSSSGLTVPPQWQQGRQASEQEVNQFVQGYLEAALWSSTDQSDDSGGEPLDRNYDIRDIHPDSIADATSLARSFIDHNYDALNQYVYEHNMSWEQAGHDFWLTRNGHGAGFWDRGVGPVGDQLTDASKSYGEADMYPGDGGWVYHS